MLRRTAACLTTRGGWLPSAAVVLALLGPPVVQVAADGSQGANVPAELCRDFSEARLEAGRSLRRPLLRKLELHLRWQDVYWSIAVNPADDQTVDYLWVVSPPLQTAPHRVIGPAYGLDARHSAAMERALRFVLSRREYDRARAVAEDPPDDALVQLEKLGRGRLWIRVTDYRLRSVDAGPETFDWIRFDGRFCVPRAQR